MIHLVLVQPEIPPNTGNIIRLAANTGATLHLVRPLGFALDNRSLERAGLDYHDLAMVHVHHDWATCRAAFAPEQRLFAVDVSGTQFYADVAYAAGDVLVFGNEGRGLPPLVLESIVPSYRLRIPMQDGRRSLNLANAASVVAYEAWRQLGFSGGR
jgi:tRNA (cytidine/uridine-2'-O-)-methyltransferase